MSELPKGWEQLELADCVEILDSKRKPVNNRERQSRVEGKLESELYPYYGATGQVGYIDDYLFDEELVALGEDGVPFFDPLKHKAYMISGKTWVNNHAHVLKGVKVNNKYLCYYLNQADYHGYVNGATRLKLTQANMRKMPIKVAPFEEQKRIADKLDSVLTKVEAAQTRLDKIPAILKRFRQSVLAAATSGELTKEWREENDLDRGDPKGAYPESWQQLMIDDIAEVKGGKRLPKGEALVEQDTGYLYIRAGQLKNGTVIDGNDTRNRQMFISNEVHQQIKRYTVEGGDAYITIVGASIGDAGVIPDRVSGANLTENAAKLTNFKVPLSVDFLSCWLRSETLQALIKLEIKSGAQGKLALKRIKTLPFPYPSLNEQREIVKKFEELTIISENVEKQYQAAKKRLDKLTQSILAKAFKGELLSNSVDSNIEAIENSIEALNA